tara:strand:- start:233 stop:1369 length:1137 start_codon:yes stop_codon:yes gene_type:complete
MNSGFILINKPQGPTSHDIIDQLRRKTGIKKIGHAGTLDPFAEGLLLVAIGDATKLLRHYVGLDKTYEATLKLGAVSDTYDRTGKIEKGSRFPAKGWSASGRKVQGSKLKKEEIQKVLKSFIGKQMQLPPMFSAKKVKGKKLYELARAGKKIRRKSSEIEIYNIKLKSHHLKSSNPNITFTCHVSSGTYIRTLAHDIGQKLGTGAYLEELNRTEIGDFKIKGAITTKKLAKTNWQKYLEPMKTVLVSGTFDGLHEGHKNYFQQARELGHRLICIVGRASIVKKIKGKEPRLLAKERIKQVKQCPEIDQVYLGVSGPDEEVYDFTASLKPDIIALGYDQKAYTKNLAKEMKKRGLDTKVIRLKPFQPKKYKNSKINKKP